VVFDVTQVKGFLDPAEGERLQDLAQQASRTATCLEVGSYCGKSTVYLGKGCAANNGIIYAVDHHRGSEEHQRGEEYYDAELFDQQLQVVDSFREFRKTIRAASLENLVVPIVATSQVAGRGWANPLALVFIDGGHSEEAAFTDLNTWSQHIIVGGYLAIHDIFPDPEEGGQAPYNIYKAALASGEYEVCETTKTLGVLRKVA
jgi:predicted O-methyltransferase YrrM